jgi:hypothetical protein
MNRREFVKLAGAGMPVAALAEAVVSAQQAQAPAKSGIVAPTTSQKAKMKVGTQHGHSDAILRACAAFGVNTIGSGTMSSEMLCDATSSRNLDSDSTDHASSIFGDGNPLQMLFTPNAAHARRMASEWPCCVPTFIFTFGDVVGATMPDFAGVCATCAETTASARAPADMPAPASRTNSRRFMTPP